MPNTPAAPVRPGLPELTEGASLLLWETARRHSWLGEGALSLKSFPRGEAHYRVLARVACLSPNHLLRTFRQLFGESPFEMLGRVRLEKARELLTAASVPMAEVCAAVGLRPFPHLRSFSSVRTGCRRTGTGSKKGDSGETECRPNGYF